MSGGRAYRARRALAAIGLYAVLWADGTGAVEPAAGEPGRDVLATHVLVDYFYEPGCPECELVRHEILPVLENRLGGFYILRSHDMNAKSSVARLVAYQRALGIAANEPVSMFVDYRTAFCGIAAMRTGLVARVEQAAMARTDPAWAPPEPITVPVGAAETESIADRVREFALLAVIWGGLLDGINPCAISTLVFFMSMLGVAKIGGRGLLLVGIAFCGASFLTYTALGFGLLQVLHAFDGFPAVRSVIEGLMVLALVALAALSFRDAWSFARTGRADAVTLQLPDAVKQRIHRVMRTRMRTGNLVAGGLLVGATVTALESVCTGQVYVPTLVVVVRSGVSSARAWLYLLLYNAMFVAPLVVAFLLTYFGLRTQTLLKWSKRNVVASKVLLGGFFLGMAALIVVLKGGHP